ncbi:MAG: CCA tRNA nucleotidyltransferase [Alphaproteobacteria bacterium]|nr:MAG: CCA tRNA nucleotidyltransferase [Alphaproteobacteria bacterium]
MRIEADWISDPATQAVMAALTQDGGEAFFVGGCVRDTVLGFEVKDVDIATPLWPEEVIRRIEAAGLKAVPTGIAHGTITAVSDGRPFEVTTYRRDIATDGRRAVVAFSRDIADDAQRRDFTMNALYADAEGGIVDPLGAFDDLKHRRVRFVGDPVRRIREDYLRILRFFRFIAWYGNRLHPVDPAGLAACATEKAGLAKLSAERVGAEIRRLLAAPDPTQALEAMAGAGVLEAVLPGAHIEDMPELVRLERQEGMEPRWIRRARLMTDAELQALLRLSNSEARALAAITAALARPEPPAARGFRWGIEAAEDAELIEAARGKPLSEDWRAEIARGAESAFPLEARDLMPPLKPGPELGAALHRLREAWIASDFTLDADALKARL